MPGEIDIDVRVNTEGDKKLPEVANNLKKVGDAAKKASQDMSNLPKGANQASAALINLGRIAQDAPFGIIGITNNINPLLESFQRLQREAGGTGNALRALASSLIGGGGLGLAISVVAGLMTVFAMNSNKSSEAVKEHKDKIDEVAEAAKRYEQAIGAASNAVIGHQDKLIDLNRTLKDVSNNFNSVTQSVINQAVAQFLATQKEGLIQKVIDARIKQTLKYKDALNGVREFSQDLISKDPFKKAVAEATADLKNLNDIVKELGLEDLFGKIFEKEVKVKKIKVKPEEIRVVLPEKKLEFDNKLDFDLKIEFGNVQGQLKYQLEQAAKRAQEELKKSETMAGIFADMATDIGNGIGNALGNALAGKGNLFANLFKAIFESLGAGMKKLGVFFLANAKLIQTIRNTIVKVPHLAIAASIALIALGALIQSSASKIPGFAGGVRNFRGGLAVVGERGPELVDLPRGSSVIPNNQIGNVGGAIIFIPDITLRGQDLVIAFNRASRTISRNG